jgi:hypothetical protein
MAERKMRYAVLTYFEKYFMIGNKARYQWDADNLLESYSYDEIKKVIDYFAKVTQDPSWKKFVYNFDDYRKAMNDLSADRITRRTNLERLKRWISE